MPTTKTISREEQVKISKSLQAEKPLVWARENCRTEKGDKLDFHNHQFLMDIYEDMSKNIVVQKSAQTGLTTFGINRALWFGDTHSVSIIYTFPTSSDVSEFSRARVKPIIQLSNYLMSRIADIDAVELKQIGGSFIYFRGTWSERQAISIPADMLIHDETDRSKPAIISMYQERLSHSKYKHTIHLSNPSHPDYGINALYNRSDRKKWFIKCNQCKKPQVLQYPESIHISGDDIYYQCVFCGGRITDDDRRNGYWESTNPGAKISGYHITQLMAPWISAEEIIEKKEQERWLQTFYNFVLGEPYAGENVPIKRTDLLECVQNKYDLENEARYTYMGVDQGDEVHVTIWKKDKDIKRLVYAEHITGKDGKDPFDRLPELMDKYHVISCVIDAMPNKHSARRFALQFPGRVWLCYYSDSQKEIIKWKEDADTKEYSVTTHRTETFDKLADEIRSKNTVLPKLTQVVDEFMRHCCALAKEKVERPDGTIVWKYLATGPDHFAHSANYAMIAWSRATSGSLAEMDNRPRKRDRPITAGLMEQRF